MRKIRYSINLLPEIKRDGMKYAKENGKTLSSLMSDLLTAWVNKQRKLKGE